MFVIFLFCRGDPDKCSLIGNTAMHCAAYNGHLNCVSFLVNFGVNIWSLDNDFHTSLDLAAMQENMDIVKYLDEVAAKQSALNKKTVARLREKSITEAQKRQKIYEKMQKQANKKAQLENQRAEKVVQETIGKADRSTLSKINPFKKRNGSISSGNISYQGQGAYSIYVTSGKKPTGPAAKKAYKVSGGTMNSNEFKVGQVEGGKRTSRSLQGVQAGSEIMYMPTSSLNGDSGNRKTLDDVFIRGKGNMNISRTISEPEMYHTADSGYGGDIYGMSTVGHQSIFERPGFGNFAFRHGTMAKEFGSIAPEHEDINYETSTQRGSTATDNSIGSVGSLAQRSRQTGDGIPWDDDILLEDDEYDPNSPLEVFLAANNLHECIGPLNQEKIDLSTLMLLSDSDMKEAGLPLGPRRKLMDAILKRKLQLGDPGPMEDTPL